MLHKDPSFAFCIALIARDRAKDWARVVKNLQATLQSLLNQSDSDFVIMIACENPVELAEMKDPRVKMKILAPLTGAELHLSPYALANVDKRRKHAFLTAEATALNVLYMMICDADDLVGSHVVQMAKEIDHRIGYVFRNGYVYDQFSRKYLPCPSPNVLVDGFDTYCGSSVIYRLAGHASKNPRWPYDVLDQVHSLTRNTLIQSGEALLDLEQPSVIYVLNTAENTSSLDGNLSEHHKFADYVVSTIQRDGQLFSQTLLKSFGMADESQMNSPNSKPPFFAFCISLISRQRSKNWLSVLDNLQATLQSILNQTEKDFAVYIATGDAIDLRELTDPRIVCVVVPESSPPSANVNEFQFGTYDQFVKRTALVKHAQQLGVEYVMSCDADDLVSDGLVALVKETHHPIGYAIRKGYVLDNSNGKLMPCPHPLIAVDGFDSYCGSTIILKITTDVPWELNWPFDILDLGHNHIRKTLIEKQRALMDIDHPSVVYVLDGQNSMSRFLGNQKTETSFLEYVLGVLQKHGKIFSPILLREFGLVVKEE
jgi:hypothetical protein